MEDIYVNVEYDKSVHSRPSTDQTGPSSSERRFYRAVVLCLGLLSVFLLAGLIGLGVHYHNSVHRAAAELSTIKVNMTELLQDSKNKVSSMTAEKDQLNTRLSSMTAEKDQLNTRLSSMTAEKDQLNTSLIEMTKDRDRLDRLSRQKRTCPEGWTMFSCSCYFLSSETGSWTKGREDCRNRGADLVVIDGAEEQKFLSGFAKMDAWIGLSDGDKEGTWKWIDGTPLTFKNWEDQEPNDGGNNGNEDCVQIRAQKGVWNDLPCETSLQKICEKAA